MLADELDYVIGVDPHRDAHALAVVDVHTGGVVSARRGQHGRAPAASEKRCGPWPLLAKVR
jgi:hypothetical protein